MKSLETNTATEEDESIIRTDMEPRKASQIGRFPFKKNFVVAPVYDLPEQYLFPKVELGLFKQRLFETVNKFQ